MAALCPEMNVLRRIAFIVLAGVAASAAASDALVLSPTALGPLTLGKGTKVSEAKLKTLFPGLSVKYEIGSGDSPDFHYFEVSTPKGEVLFTRSNPLLKSRLRARKRLRKCQLNYCRSVAVRSKIYTVCALVIASRTSLRNEAKILNSEPATTMF